MTKLECTITWASNSAAPQTDRNSQRHETKTARQEAEIQRPRQLVAHHVQQVAISAGLVVLTADTDTDMTTTTNPFFAQLTRSALQQLILCIGRVDVIRQPRVLIVHQNSGHGRGPEVHAGQVRSRRDPRRHSRHGAAVRARRVTSLPLVLKSDFRVISGLAAFLSCISPPRSEILLFSSNSTESQKVLRVPLASLSSSPYGSRHLAASVNK